MSHIKTTEIERVRKISKEEFIQKYYKPQKPVLIEGLTQNWEAFQKWNLDYIQAQAGDQIVPLYNNEPTKGKQNSAEPATEMKMADYIELIKTKPTDLRIFFYDLKVKLPELLKDFEYPDIGLKFFKRLPVLFFGGEGSKVLPHYDMDLADLVHFHFHGTKSVMLFSPEQTKYLYKIPFAVHNLESIDLDNPDFEKYPALQYLEGLHATMKHGDALYMPSGYWHYIKYLDGGFSMTLRAFPRNVGRLGNMLYNVLLMRNFENLMRKSFGQKWIDYKESRTLAKTNKSAAKLKKS
ncbi:Cupin superfamily protein [Aequorivita sublithincola DSM 14238]|uniref:Cupin superfamily protein n=1 Tax=Aequorivita sublithincola (strain DSM 14238 / LMG 21431 / ACAM 643 / 9-3) TaxID=746697 RepID=I3YTU5_AEQSU|nr:cupin-like domain-containing protein [Aequorivita sublithincola]AFL80413.1 Cupin superfamily protein [Aequorivita sublithincola DSM 14238]